MCPRYGILPGKSYEPIGDDMFSAYDTGDLASARGVRDHGLAHGGGDEDLLGLQQHRSLLSERIQH